MSSGGTRVEATRVKRALCGRRSARGSIVAEVEDSTSRCKGYSTSYADPEHVESDPKFAHNKRASVGAGEVVQSEGKEMRETTSQFLVKDKLGLDQLTLLESIGALTKCKSTYYPPTIEEVEFFVKTLLAQAHALHITCGLTLSPVEAKVTTDVQYLGLSAYRNNLHLTDREECVVLMDWFGKMRHQYTGERLGFFRSSRNLQLLLSFCITEIVRMNKLECSERALLIQLVWEQGLELAKTLENKVVDTKTNIESLWRKKYGEFRDSSSGTISSLRIQLASAEKAEERFNEENARQARKIEELERTLADYKDRYQALSAIVDHVLASNVADLKKFNKKQKRLMLATLKRLQKDRMALAKIFPGQTDLTTDQILQFQYTTVH